MLIVYLKTSGCGRHFEALVSLHSNSRRCVAWRRVAGTPVPMQAHRGLNGGLPGSSLPASPSAGLPGLWYKYSDSVDSPGYSSMLLLTFSGSLIVEWILIVS